VSFDSSFPSVKKKQPVMLVAKVSSRADFCCSSLNETSYFVKEFLAQQNAGGPPDQHHFASCAFYLISAIVQ